MTNLYAKKHQTQSMHDNTAKKNYIFLKIFYSQIF